MYIDVKRTEELGQTGKGPLVGSPSERNLIIGEGRLTAWSLQQCRYSGFHQPDVLKKLSLACFPNQAISKHNTCGARIASFAGMFEEKLRAGKELRNALIAT
jgi:hypothetical protein